MHKPAPARRLFAAERDASVSASGSASPPKPSTQVRHRPPSGYIPDIGSLPRTSDGGILINYIGPYQPASLQVFLEMRGDLRYLRYSRTENDEMKLAAEISPSADFQRFQRLLGAVRGLGQAGHLLPATDSPTAA